MKEGNYEEAGKRFSESMLGLRLVCQGSAESLSDFRLNEPFTYKEKELDLMKDVVMPCHKNLARVADKLKRFDSCVSMCDKILQVEP